MCPGAFRRAPPRAGISIDNFLRLPGAIGGVDDVPAAALRHPISQPALVACDRSPAFPSGGGGEHHRPSGRRRRRPFVFPETK
jgi:hypothetical protein